MTGPPAPIAHNKEGKLGLNAQYNAQGDQSMYVPLDVEAGILHNAKVSLTSPTAGEVDEIARGPPCLDQLIFLIITTVI